MLSPKQINLLVESNRMICCVTLLLFFLPNLLTAVLQKPALLLKVPLLVNSAATGVWIHLGTCMQVPKSCHFQTRNDDAGCSFLLASRIREITNRFRNLRCQVKLPESKKKQKSSKHEIGIWSSSGRKNHNADMSCN